MVSTVDNNGMEILLMILGTASPNISLFIDFNWIYTKELSGKVYSMNKRRFILMFNIKILYNI